MKLKKFWPYLLILVVVLIFFYPVWLKGQIPLPGDFIVGTYYPWLDYKFPGFPAGVPVKNPITTDVVSFIYPMQMYAVDLIKQGIIPLWNPLILSGTPLLANFQSAPFSPTNFLYFILPQLQAWSIQIMAQPLLAAFFLYLLLRYLGRSKLASIAGGIFYAFAGFNTIWLEWNGHALVAAFFPLIFLLTLKWLDSKRMVYGVLLSVAIALQIFSGYPQIILYEFLALILLIIIFRKSSMLSKSTLSLGIFIILGITLSAIQIIPGLELLQESQRTVEDVVNVSAFLPWQYLITFLAPDYFGNHVTRNFWGEGDYTLVSGFSGVVAIILAGLGCLIWWKEKQVKFALSLVGLSLLIALPNPLTFVLKESGLLGLQAASAHRALVLSNLGVAILTAFGVDGITSGKLKLREVIRATYLPIVLLGGFAVGTFIAWRLSDLSNLEVALRNLVLPLMFFSFSMMILFGGLIFKKYQRFAVILLIVLATSELFRFGWKFTSFSPREFVYPKTPVIDFLSSQPQPFRVVAEDVIPINMMMSYKQDTVEGYDAVYPVTYAKYLATLNSGQTDTTPQGRYGSVSNFDSPLFDLANAKYILALKRDKNGKPSTDGMLPDKFLNPNFKKVFEENKVVVLENVSAQPRAFFVTLWQTASGAETLSTLLDKNFPTDKKIILDEEFNQFPQSVTNKAEIKDKGNGEIEVKTDMPGLLFLSENYFPGWKASVDGKETKILRANYTFRAIPMGSGEHRVKIYYQPKSFQLGLIISLLSMGFLGMMIVIKKKI